MKKTLTKLLAAFIAIMMVAGVMPIYASASDASDTIYLALNDELIEFDIDDVIIDEAAESIYLPFSVIMETLGSKVQETPEYVYADFEKNRVTIVKDSLLILVSHGQHYTANNTAAKAIYDEKTDEYYIEFGIFETVFGWHIGYDEEARVLVAVEENVLAAYAKGDMSFDKLGAVLEYAKIRSGKTFKVNQLIEADIPVNGEMKHVEAELNGYVRNAIQFDINYTAVVDGTDERTVDIRADLTTGNLYVRIDDAESWIEYPLTGADPIMSVMINQMSALARVASVNEFFTNSTFRRTDLNDADAWDKLVEEAARNFVRLSDKAFAYIPYESDEYDECADYIAVLANPEGFSPVRRMEIGYHADDDVTTGAFVDIELAGNLEDEDQYVEAYLFVDDYGTERYETVDVFINDVNVRSIFKYTTYEEVDVEIECYPDEDDKVYDIEGNEIEVQQALYFRINGVEYTQNTIPMIYENDTLYVSFAKLMTALDASYLDYDNSNTVDIKVSEDLKSIILVSGDGSEEEVALDNEALIDSESGTVMVPISIVKAIFPDIHINFNEEANTLIIVQNEALFEAALEGMDFNMIESAFDIQHRLDSGKWNIVITRDTTRPDDAVDGSGLAGIIDGDTGNFAFTFINPDAEAIAAQIEIRGDVENGKYYFILESETLEIWVEITYDDVEEYGASNIKVVDIVETETDIIKLIYSANNTVLQLYDFTELSDWDNAVDMIRRFMKPVSDAELALNNYKAHFVLPDAIAEDLGYNEVTYQLVPNSNRKSAKEITVTLTVNGENEGDATYVSTTNTINNTIKTITSVYEGGELVKFEDAVIRATPTKETPVVTPDEDAIVLTLEDLEELIEAAEEEVTEEEAAEEEVVEEEIIEEEAEETAE